MTIISARLNVLKPRFYRNMSLEVTSSTGLSMGFSQGMGFENNFLVERPAIKRLALFSIQQTDLPLFSEDRRGVKWLCN